MTTMSAPVTAIALILDGFAGRPLAGTSRTAVGWRCSYLAVRDGAGLPSRLVMTWKSASM